jgi:hypothetical protein
MRGISGLADKGLTFKERLYTMELVSKGFFSKKWHNVFMPIILFMDGEMLNFCVSSAQF